MYVCVRVHVKPWLTGVISPSSGSSAAGDHGSAAPRPAAAAANDLRPLRPWWPLPRRGGLWGTVDSMDPPIDPPIDPREPLAPLVPLEEIEPLETREPLEAAGRMGRGRADPGAPATAAQNLALPS